MAALALSTQMARQCVRCPSAAEQEGAVQPPPLHEHLHWRAKRDTNAKMLSLQSFLRKGVSLGHARRNKKLRDQRRSPESRSARARAMEREGGVGGGVGGGERERERWRERRSPESRPGFRAFKLWRGPSSADRERALYWQTAGPNQPHRLDDFSRPVLRHGSLNSPFEVALHLPSY